MVEVRAAGITENKTVPAKNRGLVFKDSKTTAMIFDFNTWPQKKPASLPLAPDQSFTTYKNKTTARFFPEKKVSSLQK